MNRHNHFVIHNDTGKFLILNIEPESAEFALPKGEKVLVTDVFTAAPVTIRLSTSERAAIVSIWPGDGDVTVKKDGMDVLDMIQRAGKARSA